MADLIIWDEAPMMHRNAFKTVDRTFQDIMKSANENLNSDVFGGKVVVLGGDFRQILSVIPKAGREMIVSSSLQWSYIWKRCHVFLLKINMRLFNHSNAEQRTELEQFAKWVSDVGEGTITRVPSNSESESELNWIEIPDDFPIKGDNDMESLVNNVYPNI